MILGGALPLHAQSAKKKVNPASKIYFSEVKRVAEIDTGDTITDLTQRAVYSAEGTVIETKRPESESDQGKDYSATMIYSNGTGAYFDTDTRVELKRFAQEPFIPSRSDADLEPSISQTQAYVSRGTVGLCTSKLVAGSIMSYQTPHGSVNIRGRRVVIEATSAATKISMLEGDGTVKAGAMDMGGHSIKAGQQAIIRPGAAGQPNSIRIIDIPPQEAPRLADMVTIACAAKKTVYFEVRERPRDAAEPAGADAAATDSTVVTAFDGDSLAPAAGGDTVREIVPVPVVPVNLPVQFTVSPATLPAPGANSPGG